MGEVTKNFRRYQAKLKKAINDAIKMYEMGVKPSIIEVTPKDSGRLRESYRFSKIRSDSSLIEYTFHFGNGLTGTDGLPYASVVHEWQGNVNWTTPGTGAGYLLQPVLATTTALESAIKVKARGIKI